MLEFKVPLQNHFFKKVQSYMIKKKYPVSNQRNIPVAAHMAQFYLNSQNG